MPPAAAHRSLTQVKEIPTAPWEEAWQRWLSIFVAAALFFLPALTPRLYLRRRTAIITACKLIFYSFPLLRKPK